jgi:hypothetical protein
VYSHVETVFSRHFVGSFSSCRKIGETREHAVKELLPEGLVKALEKTGELIVADPDVVVRVLGAFSQRAEVDPDTYLVVRKVRA